MSETQRIDWVSRTTELQESLRDPKLYCNRELSLLAFQDRVLEEALHPGNPLLERVKFLAIFGSNMDEFFMVRVAAFQQQLQAGADDLSLDGRTAAEQLVTTRVEAGLLIERAYACWRDDLLPALAAEGIHVVDYSVLSPEDRAYLANFFRASVFPVLTPLGYDPGRPFPHISSLSLNLAVLLRDRAGVERFARIKIPDTIDQLIALPSTDLGVVRLVWLEQIIVANVGELFPGAKVMDCYPFRITRDAEVEIQELESDDLLETIEEAVWQRRFRNLVRLELNREVPQSVLAILGEELEARSEQTVHVAGPLDFKRLLQLCSLDRPRLKFRPFVPATPPALQSHAKEDMFAAIRRDSILLHHPFDSFQPVVDFLRIAAVDPQVLAIKMTLYRVGRDSPVVKALLSAVQEGKQVSVLVELKARFDEESNIEWAKALEADGVHVVYGILGLKVHSKVALVVRRESDGIRKYVHLGTGNYNSATARMYTDLSLLTCDDGIGDDAVTLFNRLTGYSEHPQYNKLLVAPDSMRAELIRRIAREIEFAERGTPARIVAKMNGIDDPEVIRWLYQASQAGVKIDLLVRGICCLRPGIPGISENIRVRSILGRFLEHSRVFSFRNGGKTEILLGSADWMTRNLSRRIEVLFPIEDRRLIRRLSDMLETYLADNVGAREMLAGCGYTRLRSPSPGEAIEAQSTFLRAELPSIKS